MYDGDILILNGHEVRSLLAGRELELVRTVQRAYEAHAQGNSSLPHSTFLRLPGEQGNRIIALPAYLGGGFEVAGIKWIASFPGNTAMGLDRASAVVVLNSTQTGRPQAIIEGSIISAKRTAASAALAADCLHGDKKVSCLGMIGCGLINFEIARLMLAVRSEIKTLVIFDKELVRAQQFRNKCRHQFGGIEVIIAEELNTVLQSSALIALATTAITPHIFDLSPCPPGSTILHISLRDLSPEVILSCDNIVDDIDHVCRAQTSVHLAEQQVGDRAFIRCTLADVLSKRAASKPDARRPTVFSPFGLGVLDMAASKLVYELALKEERGTFIRSFLPDPWSEAPGSEGASCVSEGGKTYGGVRTEATLRN